MSDPDCVGLPSVSPLTRQAPGWQVPEGQMPRTRSGT